MKAIIELITGFWYVWAFLALALILKVFKPRIRGYFGEKSVSFLLSRLDPSKYRVINNIMLQIGNKTTQIDHVVASNYGIFVIETKNYQGWIIGNEYDEYWRQVIYKRKEKLHNPIKQNFGHIQALKQVLSEFPELNFISIVVFTTKADLKVKAKSHVTYTIKLPRTIKKYKEECISDSVKEQIYTKLISLNIDSKENRSVHIQNIKMNLSDQRDSVNENKCPRCGGELVIRRGKYGQFKGCSNYPKCKFTV